MIPAQFRRFSDYTVSKITGHSRTKRWRDRRQQDARATLLPDPGGGNIGHDIVAYLQALRAEAGLPALPEQDVLEAMVVIEDAWLAAQNAFEAA